MRYLSQFLMPCMMLLGLSGMVGCSSSPDTQYYMLDSIKPAGQPMQVAKAPSMVIQVDIPPYLDRSDMVYRQSDNHLHIDEYHQWGGHLRDNIASTLAQNLDGRLTSANISVAPAMHMSDKTLVLYIRIRAFERMPDGHVHLSAYWQLLSHGEAVYSSGEELTGEKTLTDQDYDGMAADMSMLLAQLSDHIVGVVQKYSPS